MYILIRLIRVIIKSLFLGRVSSCLKVRFNFNYIHYKQTNGKRLFKKLKYILFNGMPSVPPLGYWPVAIGAIPYILKSLKIIVAV